MDSGTLSDESFSTYAKANFELVKIDEAENGVEFEKLGITSVPAVVVLGSDGKEIARITGSADLEVHGFAVVVDALAWRAPVRLSSCDGRGRPDRRRAVSVGSHQRGIQTIRRSHLPATPDGAEGGSPGGRGLSALSATSSGSDDWRHEDVVSGCGFL